MKGNGYIKVKKLVHNQAWIKRKINECLKRDTMLQDYKLFQCPEHFVGPMRSKVNKEMYNHDKAKNDRRFRILQNIQLRLTAAI